MPLKLAVGITKKIGQPDYGSLGASCHVEVELDQSLVFEDLDVFQKRVKQAYVACHQAVHEELIRHQKSNGSQTDHGTDGEHAEQPAPANGQNGHNGHRATQKQLDYARQLAGQIRGLGVRRLETLAGKMFSKPLADLTSLDASGLIDALKAIKAGTIELAAALDGAGQ